MFLQELIINCAKKIAKMIPNSVQDQYYELKLYSFISYNRVYPKKEKKKERKKRVKISCKYKENVLYMKRQIFQLRFTNLTHKRKT